MRTSGTMGTSPRWKALCTWGISCWLLLLSCFSYRVELGYGLVYKPNLKPTATAKACRHRNKQAPWAWMTPVPKGTNSLLELLAKINQSGQGTFLSLVSIADLAAFRGTLYKQGLPFVWRGQPHCCVLVMCLPPARAIAPIEPCLYLGLASFLPL